MNAAVGDAVAEFNLNRTNETEQVEGGDEDAL